MSFNIGNLHFSAPLPIAITGIAAWGLILILCVVSWRRSVRPGRTGLLELLRLLCGTVTVFFLLNPEWRKTIEPVKQPEIIILYDGSGSMTTADAQLPEELSERREVVTRNEMTDAILETEFWQLLEKDGKNRVSVESFSDAPDSEDPEVNSLAVTDIYSALADRVDTRPDLRAVIMIGDGDWNARDRPAPVAAAQKMRLKDIPLFSVVTGARTRLPDLDLLTVKAPTYGIVGENVQIPFTIESSLERDVRTIVRIRDQAGVERTKNITIPRGSTYYDAILWRLQKEGSSTLELSIPFADGELVEKNNRRRFNIAGRPESIRVLVVETLPRWEYRFIRNALSRDPGVDVDCLLLHPQLGEGDGPDYITAFPDKLEDLQKYDVVFIGDVGIGEGMLTGEQAELLKGLVENQASGIVFIPGWQGHQFSLLDNELGGLIPVVLDGEMKDGQEEATDSPLSLTTEGRSSLLTMLGDTEEENPTIWRSLPGFYWHAPVIRAKSGTEVLAVHANRRHPKYGHRIPLMVTSRAGNGKVLFMGIDSAWRWRRGVEDLYHYRFWGQVARWMSYQRNMAAGERVRLYFTPERPSPGENVTLNANAFQESGAPLQDGTVLIDLTAPDGSVRRFELAKEDGSWGAFTGRFKITMPGDWKITARTSKSDEGAVRTRIIAEGAQIEKTGHPARPDVLAELSRVSRGKLVEASQLGALAQEIYDLPEPRPQIIPESQWDKWYLAAALVGLLAIFWIGRKLNGTF
ncbi:MAG: hypothetical protein MK194_15725 [Roseibacillus sp.]|nr:hypothetical protein [Roseibacillus sp.]